MKSIRCTHFHCHKSALISIPGTAAFHLAICKRRMAPAVNVVRTCSSVHVVAIVITVDNEAYFLHEAVLPAIVLGDAEEG
eukprot:7455681-Prorocentrum_lima.AAC.1